MGQDSQKVGKASDVKNVNPWTQQMFSQEGDMQNMLRGAMFGEGGQGGMMQRLFEADPNAFMGSFMQAAPGMQELAMGATNPFARQQMSMADAMAPQIAESVAAQYGGPGNAFYSGAAVDAMTRGIGDVRNQALSSVLGAQTGMAQSLFGAAMPAMAQTQMGQRQLGGQMFGQLGGMLDSSMGRTGMASMPEWWQPAYMQGGGGFGGFMGGALGGAGTGAMMGSLFPGIGTTAGAIGGALLGGAGGLFG